MIDIESVMFDEYDIYFGKCDRCGETGTVYELDNGQWVCYNCR